MWYKLFKHLLVRPYVRASYGPTLVGTENIPAEGGVILAANHRSYGETLMLPGMIKRTLTFPAKKELFEGRSLKGRVVAWFLTAVGQVPIDRSGGRAAAAGLGPIAKVLEDGGAAGIFPEGTRSPDGRLYKGHTGVARLALMTGAPVVPVGLVNTQIVKGLFGLPRMKGAVMVFGKPIDFSEYAGREHELKVLRWVTNEVVGAIQDLTGQEYVDVYVNRVKYGDLKDADLSKHVKASPNEGVTPPELKPVVDES